MYTVVAFRQSVDSAGVLTVITPIADPHIRVVGNDLYVPSWAPNVLGGYAGAVNLVQAQLRSPSIRQVFNQEITPVAGAIVPVTPVVRWDQFDNPIPLQGAEPLQAWISSTGGAAVQAVIAFLGDGPVAPVKGDIRTILATSAIAAVAGTWTNIALTFADSIPSGRYQLVGARFASTTALAARFVGLQPFARPGILGSTTRSDIGLDRFRRGNCGVLGEFMHDNPPTVDILCNAADAAAVQFYALDVIYLGK
jgi:hypothetical protein